MGNALRGRRPLRPGARPRRLRGARRRGRAHGRRAPSPRAAAATNATGAFSTGVSYLERARSLLPERAYERDYALALAVDHALAATLIPLGRVDEALATADRIVANARGALDESPGWEARILAYAALNEYPKAIAAGLEICGRLGLVLPSDPTRLDIARILGRVLWKVRNMTDETLATLPEVEDPRALRLIRIMSSMTACAYVSRPYLWPVLIGNCLTLMLRHGRGPTHALLFVWFGTALNAVGLYGASPRFSRLGTRLMGAPDGAAFLPKLHHAMGQFVSHWREPIARSAEWCREGYTLGRRVEDAEFAGYCHMGWAKARLEMGDPLAEVRATALDALETVARVRADRHRGHAQDDDRGRRRPHGPRARPGRRRRGRRRVRRRAQQHAERASASSTARASCASSGGAAAPRWAGSS